MFGYMGLSMGVWRDVSGGDMLGGWTNSFLEL
jgi:hypothetical protein